MSESAMRVVAPDVGGGFGYKGKLYPEEAIVAWAARRLRRPVRWVATPRRKFRRRQPGPRSPHPCRARARRRGPFPRAARRTPSPTSAPMSRPSAPPFRARSTARCWPASTARRRSSWKRPACSPTRCRPMPIAAPAGPKPATCWSGWPTRAARKLGLDRAEIRRRNLIPPAAMPYKTPIGPTYDCGDFPKMFARVLALADYDGLRATPRRGGAARGRLRGIGMACYVESSGVAPSRFAGALGARVGFYEAAAIRVEPDGAVRAALGTHNHGQGHATTLRADPLRRGSACRSRRSRSSRATPTRCRTAPARSARARSRSAARRSIARADKIVAKGKLIAAHLLEAARRRRRFRRRLVRGRRNRPAHHLRGGRRRPPTSPHQLPLEPGAGAAGHRGLRSAELRLQQRRARLRSRDRSATPARSRSPATGRSTTSAP